MLAHPKIDKHKPKKKKKRLTSKGYYDAEVTFGWLVSKFFHL